MSRCMFGQARAMDVNEIQERVIGFRDTPERTQERIASKVLESDEARNKRGHFCQKQSAKWRMRVSGRCVEQVSPTFPKKYILQ
jgi:hypothetical protein